MARTRSSSYDRRSANWLPIVSVLISAAALFIGPIFGAVITVVGIYVTNQTRSAVTEASLSTLTAEVKKVGDQLEKMNDKLNNGDKANAGLARDLENRSKQIDEITQNLIPRLQEHDSSQEKTLAQIKARLKME